MTLAELFAAIHRQTHRQWAEEGPAAGLTLAEYEYLRAIGLQEQKKTDKDDHGQHLQHVVALMQVSKASASTMVLKLEAAGLVKRFPCQMDARAQHIVLTASGREKCLRGEAIFAAAAEVVLSGLSEGERSALEGAFAHVANVDHPHALAPA